MKIEHCRVATQVGTIGAQEVGEEVQSQQLLETRWRQVKMKRAQSLAGHPPRILKLRRLVNDEVERRAGSLGVLWGMRSKESSLWYP